MKAGRLSGRLWWLVGFGIAVAAVIVLSPLASQDPDGLERVAEDAGFLGLAEGHPYSILPGYTVPGIEDPAISTIVAGLVGLAIVVGVVVLLGRLLARRRSDPSA